MKFIFFLIFFIVNISFLLAQIGGEQVYPFLNYTVNTTQAQLGGVNLSVKDNNPAVAFSSPSMLDSNLHNSFSTGFSSIFLAKSDIGLGYGVYNFHKNKYTFSCGAVMLNYGKMYGYDEYENSIGTFSASDYYFQFAAARSIYKNFTAGISLKPILSYLADYRSFGIAMDGGITFNDTNTLITATLLLKNVGFQLKPYVKSNYEMLPAGLHAGITKKFRNAPLRISLTYQNLQQFKLAYETPLQAADTTDDKTKLGQLTDNGLRHIIVGTELLLMKNFYVAMGYNFRKNKELKIQSKVSIVGLTFGFGVRVSGFNVQYAHQFYHLAGGTNHISLSTNLTSLKKMFGKKEKDIVSPQS